MKVLKFLLKFTLSVVLVVALGLFAIQQHGAFQKNELTRLPLFGMEGLSHADLNRDIMVLNFFASWCVPCEAEHPVLMELSQKHKIPVYGIAVKDKGEDMFRFLDRLGNPYKKIGMDYQGLVPDALGIDGLPVTLILTHDHVILWRHDGPMTDATMNEDVLPRIRNFKKGMMTKTRP